MQECPINVEGVPRYVAVTQFLVAECNFSHVNGKIT